MTVGKIQVEGNKKTRLHIITRELSFKEGDTLFLENLDQYFETEKNKIFNTQLFNSVEIQPSKNNGVLDVRIVVDERWYLWPSVQIDFGDRNINEWFQRGADLSRLVLGLSFTDKNFRGRNEKLTLRAQIGFTRKYEVFYDIPYVDKNRKTGIGFKVSYSENDQVAFETRDNFFQFYGQNKTNRTRFYSSFNFERRNRFYSRHNVNIGFHDQWVSDSIVILNPNYFGDLKNQIRFFRLSYTYTYDKRNISFYPTDGHKVEAKVEKDGIGAFEDVDVWKFNLNASKYFKYSKRIGSGHYLSGFSSLPAGNIPFFTYGGLGFKNDVLRGYDLYVINSRAYGIMKNEIRYMIFSFTKKYDKIVPVRQFQTIPTSLYFKLFADLGISDDPFTSELNPLFANQSLWSIGSGMDLTTFYDLVFRVEYSYNSNQEHNVFINLHAAF